MTQFVVGGTMGFGNRLGLYPTLPASPLNTAAAHASDPHGAHVPRPPRVAIADPRLTR